MDYLTIALPKGKLYAPTVELLDRAGLGSSDLADEDSRNLVVTVEEAGIRYLRARPSDVPTYVEHGAADLGIVGKDVLLEGEPPVYELLDLGYGECRFVLAAPEGRDVSGLLAGACRVATKFPGVTERYFRTRGVQAEIICLHGAVELAPAVGLAEMIVDIVSTGRTLKENQLRIVDEVAGATARLIANRAAYRLKGAMLAEITSRLREAAAVVAKAG